MRFSFFVEQQTGCLRYNINHGRKATWRSGNFCFNENTVAREGGLLVQRLAVFV